MSITDTKDTESIYINDSIKRSHCNFNQIQKNLLRPLKKIQPKIHSLGSSFYFKQNVKQFNIKPLKQLRAKNSVSFQGNNLILIQRLRQSSNKNFRKSEQKRLDSVVRQNKRLANHKKIRSELQCKDSLRFSDEINKNITKIKEINMKKKQKHSKNLEEEQFKSIQKHLKSIIIQINQQKAKQILLRELNQIIKQQSLQNDNKNNINDNESLRILVKKYDAEIDRINHFNNQLKLSIKNYYHDIIGLRKHRAFSSEIFRNLQKQIKRSQHQYFDAIVNTLSANKNGNNCITDNLIKTQPFNFIQFDNVSKNRISRNSFTTSFSQQPMKDQRDKDDIIKNRLNRQVTINYYTMSRKVIVIPRYKEHHDGSRKKLNTNIKLSQQTQSFNYILQLLTSLQKIVWKCNLPIQFPVLSKFNKNKKSQKYSIQHIDQKSLEDMQINLFPQDNVIPAAIKSIKNMMEQFLSQNLHFFYQIQQIDSIINHYQEQIHIEMDKRKLLKISLQNQYTNQNDQIKENQSIQQDHKNKDKQLQTLKEIADLFNINIYQPLDIVEEVINKVTKLQNLSKQTQLEYTLINNQFSQLKELNHQIALPTNKSILSLKLEEKEEKKNDLMQNFRTLNSIFKCVPISQSYEKAFERMQFEKEYSKLKSNKMKAFTRRNALVSLIKLKELHKHQRNPFNIKKTIVQIA